MGRRKGHRWDKQNRERISEFMRLRWQIQKGMIVRKQQETKPKPQRFPWEFLGEFWDLLRAKRDEYERRRDKAMLRKLDAIRHAAIEGMKCGEVPKWVENWLKYLETDTIHWSGNAEDEQWPARAEDEYNGAEDEDIWWDGEDRLSFDRLGNCKDADGLLPSERIFGRGWR